MISLANIFFTRHLNVDHVFFARLRNVHKIWSILQCGKTRRKTDKFFCRFASRFALQILSSLGGHIKEKQKESISLLFFLESSKNRSKDAYPGLNRVEIKEAKLSIQFGQKRKTKDFEHRQFFKRKAAYSPLRI